MIFGTKHTSVARIESNQTLPSTTLNLSSKVDNLSWFIKPVDLLLKGLSDIESMVIGARVG